MAWKMASALPDAMLIMPKKSCGYFQMLFAVISHNYCELFVGSDVGAFINNKRIWHGLEKSSELNSAANTFLIRALHFVR